MRSTTRATRQASFETRMMRVADRLFTEFDAMPASLVFAAINSARRSLSGDAGMPQPEDIEMLARWLLESEKLPVGSLA